MEPRYIDANVLKAAFEEDGHLSDYIEEFIDGTPTVSPDDVRVVAIWRNKVMTVPGGHGQTYNRWGCSKCKARFKTRTKYCPNCGARMEETE